MDNFNFDENLLRGINNMHELGRQRAFELGNPYYAKEKGDGEHFTKELPDGEKHLVDVEIIFNEKGFPIEIKDIYLGRK